MFEKEEDENFNKQLGEKIFKMREPKFGVREFARIAGIEHPQLLNIESGKVDIRLSTLRKIAKGLGVQPMELLNFDF